MPKSSSKTKTLLAILSIALLIVTVPQLAFAQAGPVQTLLLNIVNGVFGFFMGIAGSLLDYAIGEFVVGFGRVYETTGLGFSIDNLWSIVRDLFNLTFIFGLVFIGFKMIFNSSDSSARKMLGLLVMAALLVNFSLFITKFVIDFSNIAATQLAAGFEVQPAGTGKYQVSEDFMNILGLTSIFKTGASLANVPDGAIYGYIFGSLVMILVATFVFAAGAFLLIIRFVVLNIYMVLSPLMFLGWVFPGFSNVTKEYWSGFLSRAFFAPAYILMIYFSYQILSNMQGVLTAGSQGIGSALMDPKSASFLKTFPFFILTATFLVASLVVANKMGAVGASNTLALGKRISGGARKYATNAALAPARKVGTFASGTAAKYAERANNRLELSTGGKFAKGLVSVASLGALNERGRQNLIATGKNAKFGGKYSYTDDKDFKTKTQATANKTTDELARKNALDDSTKILEDNTASVTDLSAALDALAKSITKMSSDEKVDLGIDKLTDQNVAAHLTDAEITSWKKEGKFSSQQIAEIDAARKRGIIATAVGGSTLANVTVTKDAEGKDVTNVTARTAKDAAGNDVAVDKRATFSSKINAEVKDMPIDIFKNKNMAAYMTPQMLDELIQGGKLTKQEDAEGVRNAIQNYLADPTTTESVRQSWRKFTESSTRVSMFGISIPARAPVSNTQTTISTQPSIIASDPGGYNSTRPRT